MKKKDRLTLILETLGENETPVTASTFASRCGVTSRTIYSDIATLRSAGHLIGGATIPGSGLWLESPSTITPSPQGSQATGPPYVGRRALIDHLHATLARAMAGRFQATLLSGEPGSGKTRSAIEAAELGVQLGLKVFWGRSHDGIGAPPLWPWIQILRGVSASSRGRVLGDLDSSDIDILSRLVPEIGPGDGAGTSDASGESLRLYDAVARLLAAAASRAPLLVILDDLQWADDETIELLRYLVIAAPQTRIALLGCYRQTEILPEHPLADAIGKMQRHVYFSQVPVAPLSEEEMLQLLLAVSDESIESTMVTEFAEQAEGNPFFGIQLVESQRWSDSVDLSGQKTVLPGAIKDVTGARLSRLGAPPRELVNSAAVVGREFEIAVISHLHPSIAVVEILKMLDEIASAGIIERAQQPTHFRFTHDLMRQAVLDELHNVESVRLHQLAADALELEFSGRHDEFAARIVAHHEQAVAISGPAPIVRWATAAGWHALNTLAFGAAERHFENALVHKKGPGALAVFDPATAGTESGLRQRLEVAEGGDLELAEILHGMMRSYAALESRKGALGCLKGAFDCYVANGAIDKALEVADYPFATGLGSAAQSSVFATALELVEPDSIQHARLLSRLSIHNLFLEDDFDFSISIDSAARASAIARREGDRLVEAWAMGRHLQTCAMTAQFHAAGEISERAIRAAEESGNSEVLVHTLYWAGHADGLAGDLNSARQHAQRAKSVAQKSGHSFRLRQTLILIYGVEIQRGEWDRVGEALDSLQEFSPRPPQDVGHQYFLALNQFEFMSSAEDRDAIAKSLGGFEPLWGRLAAQSCAYPRLITGISSHTARPDLVQFTGRDLVADEPGRRDLPILYLYQAIIRGCGAVAGGTAADAHAAYETLLNFGDPSHPNRAYQGSVSRVLGQLAAKMGSGRDAEGHFQYAIDWFKDGDYGPDLAWTSHDYAAALLQRRRRVDTATVRSLLREGVAVASRLGMPPLLERLHGLETQLEKRAAGATEYPDGLTDREVEVLRLLAGGMTNRQIAEELFITQNTVESHVSSVLAKTTAQNRAEAAQYATRRGLV